MEHGSLSAGDPLTEQPRFRYHPDPVASGSAVPSDDPCSLCGQPAGLRCTVPLPDGEGDVVCLRCIADGTAAERLGAPGTPARLNDLWNVPDDVPRHVRDEVSLRTPGFVGWQQERWLYHCSDAAAFLGLVGWDDVKDQPDAVASLHADLAEIGVGTEEAQWQLEMMRRDGDLTGYLFRCLHCGVHLAYSDAS